jgi:hypothetical protein
VPENFPSSTDDTTGEHIYEEIPLKSIGELNRTTAEERMYENIA